MNNLIYAQKQFDKFLKQYGSENNSRIQLKIDHTMRVMDLNMEFAKTQNMSEEDIELAGIIGLLHDIGRFEQIKKYNTFIDKNSIDHAQVGINLLFKDNFIRYFIQNPQYDSIIKHAILNHNKYKIEEPLESRTFKHCKLIRDADKTDIFQVHIMQDIDITCDYQSDNSYISKAVIDEFLSKKLVSFKNIKNNLDSLINTMSFIFDYNFKINLAKVKEEKYIEKLCEKILQSFELKNPEEILKLRDFANKYIENELNLLYESNK